MSPVGPVGSPGAGTGAAAHQPMILTLKAPAGAIAGLPVGARLEGQVLPNSMGRGLVLQTPRGALTLATSNPPPPGTTLTLEVRSTGESMRFAVLATDQLVKGAGPEPLIATQSKATTPPRIETQQAGSTNLLPPNGVPAADADGPGPLAALLGLRAGLRAWVGGERIGRMGTVENTLAGNREQAGRAEVDGWRLVPMPFVAQGEDPLARLWLRPAPKDRPGAPIQISLDLDLPATGPLRFDGTLLESRFDLVLTAETPLPESLSRDLPGLFARAGAAVGLAGRFSMTPATTPIKAPEPGPAEGILV